ncbi:hypothetical protein [Micromonospora sp. WMMA1996]|uniref:hypothetical protein n=1 Tax=Micromonospora sp. WMMA1996 TaxID=2039878 RepID=UPI001C3F35A1|nr:hypothetical protein [Micromonospora sp. WMMA1996]
MRGGWVGWTLLTIVVLWYPLSCLVYPHRDCRVCRGQGCHRSSGNPKLSRPCRWCGGSGKRLRLGRRAWRRIRRGRRTV